MFLNFPVPETYFLAENLLIEAAKNDIPSAFTYLGILHKTPKEGFKNDVQLAVSYFEKAIEIKPEALAQQELADLLSNGEGVKIDINRANELRNQSSSQVLSNAHLSKTVQEKKTNLHQAHQEQLEEEKKKLEQKAKTKKTAFLVAGGVILAGTAFFVYRKLKNRK